MGCASLEEIICIYKSTVFKYFGFLNVYGCFSMGTITINVDDKVEERFRKEAGDKYNRRKGYLGKAVTDALDKWVQEERQKEISRRQLTILKKGLDLGRVLYKDRGGLYDRSSSTG